MFQLSKKNLCITAGVASLLGLLFLQLALSVRQNSITWDEDDHIYAGYMSWKQSDFGLNPEHPPLVKMLGTLPLLNMSLKVPPLQNRNFKQEAFLGGKDFLFKNDADVMLFRARMAAALLTLVLATLVFLAAQEMFGTGAAFIALALLVFDPNLLAHGAVVEAHCDSGLSHAAVAGGPCRCPSRFQCRAGVGCFPKREAGLTFSNCARRG